MKELIDDIEKLITIWDKRAENEDNGIYPGEYYQPPSPTELCSCELKKLIYQFKQRNTK